MWYDFFSLYLIKNCFFFFFVILKMQYY
jgi:hypothetical protein